MGRPFLVAVVVTVGGKEIDDEIDERSDQTRRVISTFIGHAKHV